MEERTYSFTTLNTYTEAKGLVKLVYAVINTLPQTERYALADQLRRSVISVPSNVVEGMNRSPIRRNRTFLRLHTPH